MDICYQKGAHRASRHLDTKYAANYTTESMIHRLAQELNSTLSGTAPGSFLSDLGERIYFPKGIIAQSAEAKKLGKKANATIGMTL